MASIDRRRFLKAAGVAGAGAAASRACRPGHRPVVAGDQVAHADELAQVARHAAGRRRSLRQAGGGGDRRQVPDPDHPGRRRADPGSGGHRRRVERHGRGLPHGALLHVGQGPDLRLRLRRAVRPQRPHAELLVAGGRRRGADERVLRQVQHLRPARRQHHGPDGRLVPQGDQHHRRPEGREDAHRRLCRRGRSPSSASPRSSCRAPTSTRRWRRAPSMPPNGSARTTTRSSACTRWPSSTTTRAGGKAAP